MSSQIFNDIFNIVFEVGFSADLVINRLYRLVKHNIPFIQEDDNYRIDDITRLYNAITPHLPVIQELT